MRCGGKLSTSRFFAMRSLRYPYREAEELLIGLSVRGLKVIPESVEGSVVTGSVRRNSPPWIQPLRMEATSRARVYDERPAVGTFFPLTVTEPDLSWA